MSNLFIGLGLLFLAQVIVWFATNGQFIWKSFANHPFLLSLFFGTISCYIFILATKYCTLYFNYSVWPVRILSFCMGIASFTVLSWIFLHEAFNMKTAVCLILSTIIMMLQIFWK